MFCKKGNLVSSNDYDLAAIYQLYKDDMHRMASSVLWDYGLTVEAEDVVHTVIVEIMQTPPKEPVKNWQAYLITITKRRSYDKVKEAFVKNRDRSLDKLPDFPDTTQDLSQDVADNLERLAEAAHLHKLLAALPAQEREILWRVFGLEEKQSSIAEEMGLSRSRISQICRSGLIKLRAQMTELRTKP